MRERSLIAFTLFMLVAVLKPFSLRGQELQPPPPAGLQTASFACGCFWCMVHPFEVIDGGTFQISEAFQERYGYPKMTPELRAIAEWQIVRSIRYYHACWREKRRLGEQLGTALLLSLRARPDP